MTYLYAGDGNDQLNNGTSIDSLYGNSGRDTVPAMVTAIC